MQSKKTILPIILILVAIAGFLIFQKITYKPPVDVWVEPPFTGKPAFNSEYLGIKFDYPEGFAEVDCGGEAILPCLNDSAKTDRISKRSDVVVRMLEPGGTNNFEKTVMEDVTFDPSGLKPQSLAEFEPITIGKNTFYKIRTGLFEGILTTSYYLDRGEFTLVFDVTSSPVDWTSPDYNPENDQLNKQFLEMLNGVEFTEPRVN